MEFPINTQEEFDAAIRGRIKRAKDDVRAEFADYQDLKDKAGQLDQANNRIKELEDAAAKRDTEDKVRQMREKVSKDTGVPVNLITGNDEESMTAFAKSVADFAKVPAAPKLGESGKFAGKASADGKDVMREYAKELLS